VELRPIKFSRDLTSLVEMICDTFQYPETPEWSVQTDEKEQISRRAQFSLAGDGVDHPRQDRMPHGLLSCGQRFAS